MNNTYSVLFISTISLLFFQNCSQHEFGAIDPAQKLSTLEGHAGLDQGDRGLGGGGPSNTGDGGLAGGPSNTGDGGFGSMPNTDGGLGGAPSNTGDGGFGSMPNTDGGLGGAPSNTGDGGFSSMPNTDGGLGGGTSNTGDGGINMGTMTQTFGMGMRAPNTNDGGLSSNPSNQPDGGKSTSSTPDGGMNNPPPVAGNAITDSRIGRFQVVKWCRGRDKASTLKEADAVSISVENKMTGEVVCQASGANLLAQILNGNYVDVPNCDFSALPANQVRVVVNNQAGETLSDGTDGASKNNAYNQYYLADEESENVVRTMVLHLLYDKNVPKSQKEKCEAYNSSPLVIDMRTPEEQKQIFTLSAPSFGVVFDILGVNSYPSPYQKKKISWFQDPRIMPLVLPRSGEELGVDQLFGDNTLGPDDETAADGFAALAKYDGLNLSTYEVEDADGLITRKDPVFRQLRLWSDRNLDGVIDRGELISLRRAGVQIIDLNFDKNYYSRDYFGNEIKYKSVVKFRNGDYRPIFDVWFVIKNAIQEN